MLVFVLDTLIYLYFDIFHILFASQNQNNVTVDILKKKKTVNFISLFFAKWVGYSVCTQIA